MTPSKRPPEPPDEGYKHEVPARPVAYWTAQSEPDRVTVNFKTTDKWGDTFVSLDVGYTSSARPEEVGKPLALYRRVAGAVNEMYNLRKAEVKKALGR